MGNLVGSWRFKEPSTVEECDSTWGSDSESDEPTAEDDSGISDSVSPAESERAAGHSGDAALQVHGGSGWECDAGGGVVGGLRCGTVCPVSGALCSDKAKLRANFIIHRIMV